VNAGRGNLSDRRVFVDSSGFLALVNPHDRHHAAATRIWTRLTDEGWRTVTTNFMVAETHQLFLVRLGQRHATAFLRQLQGSSTAVVRVRAQDEDRAKEIVFRYTDKDFSLTDASSFVVMERLGIRQAFTFDQHFAQYGLTPLQPI
jgi:uncharacterized protein